MTLPLWMETTYRGVDAVAGRPMLKQRYENAFGVLPELRDAMGGRAAMKLRLHWRHGDIVRDAVGVYAEGWEDLPDYVVSMELVSLTS
ncbi:hypothetical protein PsYK624_033930 [Phanerochaete sordida]|uniref:Uncharacterized protein n=1 Tax=Phanerochaete sordida TaxID=48140 RepID=A0A9P3L9N0_9APHY|nr:hypothetical protein PsYK624_033930 [Phanerochaete sordida]